MASCDYYRGFVDGVSLYGQARRTPGVTLWAGGGGHVSSMWQTRQIYLPSL